MKPQSLLLIGLLALAPAGYAPRTSVAKAKCSLTAPVMFPSAPTTVYVLDGKLADPGVLERLPKNSVESVEILCAADLYRVFGIESRRDGVSVFTAPGPHTALKNSMQLLVTSQNAHFEKHGRFALRVSELSWSDPTGLITVTLDSTDARTRWSARGTHRYLIRPSSSVIVSGTKP